MNNELQEFTLPPAPRGLCFDRNDFVKKNFSVDNFLSDNQNVASLETMRDDLGIYLKILRLAMIELINKDYANFVNLCATLIGFDKAIIKIQVPLGQLNDEILVRIFILADKNLDSLLYVPFKSVKQCLEDAMKELSMWLNQRHGLLKKRQLLKFYSLTTNCLNTLDIILKDISDKTKEDRIVLADRAAMKYNQLKFSISKCGPLIKAEQKMQYEDVGSKLVQTLNELLFQFWNDNQEENLLKTFIILASLDRVNETEILIRKQAVAPLLQDIINEPALQRSKDGLHGVYKRILLLLDTKLKILLAVTQHSKLTFLVKKYRFLVNCFWCEVESRLEVNLASIFAPGNPQLFYRRYSESIQFIRKLEELCHSEESVRLLHMTSEYKSFQRRWNLPVYFQIRFQEIAGGFESSLKKSLTLEKSDGFLIAETNKCWKAMEECWLDGIYIEALAHKFWKLSLQLLSRYATWAIAYCVERKPSPRLEFANVNKDLIHNCIYLYVDSQELLQRLPTFTEMVQSKVSGDKSKEILVQSFKPSEELLQGTKVKIRECIVNELYEYFNIQLKQVSEIPRLYRKTNRSIPTKHCTYIEVISRTMKDFNEECANTLDSAFLIELYNALFNMMTISYYKYVEDVLTSVQKTEESLRRLKQIRDKSSQRSNDPTGVTDGDKIRLQVNVDVLAYSRIAESLQININNVYKLNELTSIVINAVKNIDIK